jgi:hypothetical protein
MAHFKQSERAQGLFLTVNLENQLIPGTFEWTIDCLADEFDMPLKGYIVNEEKTMADVMTANTATFETVWAALQETDRIMKENAVRHQKVLLKIISKYYIFIYIKLFYQSKEGKTMVNKIFQVGILVIVIVFGMAVLMTSCSTVPAGAFIASFVVDEILGPVSSGDFDSYAEAFAAAKKEYPKAEAVIIVKAVGGNKIIPWPVKIGYYAVTLRSPDSRK